MGQEVRLLDIPADAECGYGIFENIHEFKSAHDLAEALRKAAAQSFGLLAPTFINCIIAERGRNETGFRKSIRLYLEKMRTRLCEGQGNVDGQVLRVAGRFALCALAGLLAVKFGVLSWDAKAMISNIKKCFLSWLDRRGTTGALEEIKIIQQVLLFLEQHGDARFQSTADSTAKTHNRAGVRCFNPATKRLEYYVLPGVFKTEVCKGFDYRLACEVLSDAGHLIRKESGRLMSRPPNLSTGENVGRCFLLCMSEVDAEATSHSETTTNPTGMIS